MPTADDAKKLLDEAEAAHKADEWKKAVEKAGEAVRAYIEAGIDPYDKDFSDARHLVDSGLPAKFDRCFANKDEWRPEMIRFSSAHIHEADNEEGIAKTAKDNGKNDAASEAYVKAACHQMIAAWILDRMAADRDLSKPESRLDYASAAWHFEKAAELLDTAAQCEGDGAHERAEKRSEYELAAIFDSKSAADYWWADQESNYKRLREAEKDERNNAQNVK